MNRQPASPLPTSIAFLAVAHALISTAVGQQATVVVVNPDELSVDKASVELSRAVVSAFGERKLDSLAFHQNAGRGHEDLDRLRCLVLLAAPASIDSYRSDNARFMFSPVEDFDRFVGAIDYGRVLQRDDANRRVLLQVDPKQATLGALEARAQSSPPASEIARRQLSLLGISTRRDSGPGQAGQVKPSLGAFSRSSASGPDTVDSLGGRFEIGSYAEIELGQHTFAGQIDELAESTFQGQVAVLRLLDQRAVADAVPDRRLSRAIERAQTLPVWVPVERLRLLPGPPKPQPKARTWTDTTGKFRVRAVFGGTDGDRVILEKGSGKETRVPLARLSEADRKYVLRMQQQIAATDDPFADQGERPASGGSLRADWSNVQMVRGRHFRNWSFTPPVGSAPKPAKITATALDLGSPPATGPRSKTELEMLRIAPDGSRAIAVLKTGGMTNAQRHVQLLDFVAGETGKLVRCPPESRVLDADPIDGTVLMVQDSLHVHDSTRLYVQRLTANDLTPLSDWDTHPPDSVHKQLKAARVLANRRIMTLSFPGQWTIWDRETARALHTVSVRSTGGDNVVVGPKGRFLFVAGAKAIQVIDTSTGTHSATLPNPLKTACRVWVEPSLEQIALAKPGKVQLADLRTGELTDNIMASAIEAGVVGFVDDLVLIDHNQLVEPTLPVLLWEYQISAKNRHDTHATVRGKRLWYATRPDDLNGSSRGGWTVTSIEMPHRAVRELREEIGSLNDLIVLGPGDRLRVQMDCDLDDAQQEALRLAFEKAFRGSGYVISETAGRGVKTAVVVCKQQTTPVTIKIGDRNARPPKGDPLAMVPAEHRPISPWNAWQFQTRTIRPYQYGLLMMNGDEVLLREGGPFQPDHKVYPRPGETVDDVARRMTSADTGEFTGFTVTSQMCRQGDATPNGAFGMSVLDASGVVYDRTGPERDGRSSSGG